MPQTSVEQKKFLGLFAQANSFDLPEGAMERCRNVVINDDNTASKTRGFYQYYDPSSDTLNALVNYQSKLLGVFSDKIGYFTDAGSSPNYTGTRTTLTGQTVSVTGTRISRAMEQSGNLYFTSDNGVMKLDSYSGTVRKAGAPPALDLRGQFLAANGPLNGDSEVAYRVIFGRRDANDNLILGAPSDILILTNNKVTSASYTSSGAGPYTVTVTSSGHNLATGMSVTTSGATDVDANGVQSITVISTSQFTYSVASAPGNGTLSYVTTRKPLIEFSVPSEIADVADKWFFRLYRSSQSSTAATSPDADFKLVEERILTTAEISSKLVVYQDETDDVLVQYAAELYTNPNSREGEDQANARPPLCEDVDLFQGYAFYAKCRTRHTLELDVVDTSVITSGSYVEVKVDSTTRRYVAKSGVGNSTVKAESITNAGGDLRVDYTAHGLSNGCTIFAGVMAGGVFTGVTYYVVSATANNFKVSLTSGGTPLAYSATTDVFFQGVTDGTYPIFAVDSTSSVATQLRTTAQGLVKAINRDSQSLVYASYISAISDVPGRIRLNAIGFTGTVYVRANSTSVGGGYSPTLPDSFSTGDQVYSKSDSKPASIFLSKYSEPEAVPIVNELVVGSQNKAILRCLALRDSVIVLKEDGVWKVTGDNPLNFNVSALDNTVIGVSAPSAARLNNQVYFLANQGICLATDSSVQIVSRRIENLIEPILGQSTVASETGAVGYESDRTYRISTLGPNDTVKSVTYSHNTINDTWTDADTLFKGGVVGPNNVLYLISSTGKLLKERKTGTRIDFCGQNHAVTVVSVASDLLSAVITSSGYVPKAGDAVIKADVFSRFDAVTPVSGADYTVTFTKQTNLAAADSLQLYERISSEITMAPFHAGAIGREKQVSQLQVRTRTNNVSRMSLSFVTQSFGGSEMTTWKRSNVAASGGWGYMPWGFFAWGLADGINNVYTTEPALPIRIYVPRFAQRSSFIQAVMNHSEAGEPLEIQALCWTVRGYKERVSR
jgi:hypothetical protein